MGVDNGTQIEVSRNCLSFRGVQLKMMIIRGRKEGGRVEGIEAKMGNAKLVG